MANDGFDALERVQDAWADHQANPSDHERELTSDIGQPWGFQWGGQTVLQQIDELASPYIAGRILEIGCGGGKWTKWLCDLSPDVVAVDVHQTAIDQSRMHEPRAVYKLTDGESLPFGENAFDVVFSFDVFQHLPVSLIMRYLIEARRVAHAVIFDLVDVTTKRGGDSLCQYVVHEAWHTLYRYGYYNFHSPDMAHRLLELAGWKPQLLGHVGVPGPRDMLMRGTR